MKKLFLILLAALMPLMVSCNSIDVNPEKVKIVLLDSEPDPLRLAVETLVKDFEKVTGFAPEIVSAMPQGNEPVLVVVNRSNTSSGLVSEDMPALDGFESHRVWADSKTKRIYLDGYDMRGAIYAVYTFSEQFLGVPPLWFWCSWVPRQKSTIKVDASTDMYFASPKVRYRSWLPNDTDLYSRWISRSRENSEAVYETLLRLKLNTMEDAGLGFPGIGRGMSKCKKYGIVVTAHHIYMLNVTFSNWARYWKSIRKVDEVPPMLLSEKQNLIDFWEYAAKTVVESGVENIWNIAFRGSGDQPFWVLFKDAPESEAERAAIINEMLATQVEIIKKYSPDPDPYIRITFYDEMADLLSAGLVRPPEDKNMIWTFCSGRRDHYPYDDIQKFDPSSPVKLGYYMNLQFTSTGSHLAPAEGPWKMEFNYRYVDSKSPLYLSVVNSGNFREYMYTMTANAKLLWNFDSFNCDEWNEEYAQQYFGKQYAAEIAKLYKDFFYSYWTQRKSDFPGGMERQFIFQDQRYARAVGYIGDDFFNYEEKPLPDFFGHERIAGRVFRVIPEDNGVSTQVDALLLGMESCIEKFGDVATRAEEMMNKLDPRDRTYFYDSFVAYATFMEHLSKMLYHFTYAYKNQTNKSVLVENLKLSLTNMEEARDALYKTQHDAFSTWYEGDAKFNIPEVITTIKNTLQKAESL